MAWRSQKHHCRPETLPAAISGVCGDELGSWLVVWHGSWVAWVRSGSALAEFVFAGNAEVSTAKPIPSANVIVAVLACGRLKVLQCGAGGTLELDLEVESVFDTWPCQNHSFLILDREFQLSCTDLDKTLAPHLMSGPRASSHVWTSAMHRSTLNSSPGVSSTCESSYDILLAVVGQINARGTLLIWKVRETTIVSMSEVLLPHEVDSSTNDVNPGACLPAVSMSVGPESITLLRADGQVQHLRCASSEEWTFHASLSSWQMSGLRLCAAGGLDRAVLDTEAPPTRASPMSSVQCLQVWADGDIGIVFQSFQREQIGLALELVTLRASDLTPSFLVPRLSLGARTRSVRSVSCFGSAGHHLVHACFDTDCIGNATGKPLTLEVLSRTRSEWRDSSESDARANVSVQPFHAILQVVDLEEFVERVLVFDPISETSNASAVGFGFEQLQRLLEMARLRLEHVLGKPSSNNDSKVSVGDGWDNDGWDDFDLDIAEDGNQAMHDGISEPLVAESCVVKLRSLLELVELQLRRLGLLRDAWNQISRGSCCSLPWHTFREANSNSIQHLAHQMAAEQCVPFLEALFVEQSGLLLLRWRSILDAFPETTQVDLVRRLLPAPTDSQVDTLIKIDGGGIDWYLDRAQKIIDRTGLCQVALDLLRHAIFALAIGRWPDACNDVREGILPDLRTVRTTSLPTKALYGMFRLCSEYENDYKASLRQVYTSASAMFERSDKSKILSFREFCERTPCQRAQCVLRHSRIETIVDDARAWAHSFPIHDFLAEDTPDVAERDDNPGDLINIANIACGMQVEEALVQALLSCLGGNGWDVSSFQMMAAVVAASSPAIPIKERIIRSELQLLEFILGFVYSPEQHCQAMEILESVDEMYACIPNNKSTRFAEKCRDTRKKDRWNDLQKQADQLEGHINCVLVLKEYNVKLSMTFSDMQQACVNEPMATNILWNLFRVLGSTYQAAVWWRQLQEKLFYFHEHTCKAVDQGSVYSMFVRCLVKQEHFGTEVMGGVIEDWVSKHGPKRVGGSLILLAQELANSSPALRHQSLERAQKVLNVMLKKSDGELVFDCTASARKKESDFIEACGLLHDLIHFQTRVGQRWVEDLRNISDDLRKTSLLASSALGSLSAVSAKISQQESKQGAHQATSASDFRIECPLQLRLLLLSQPLRVVTDLLQYNPGAIARTGDFTKFCSLIGVSAEEQLTGIAPTSPHWAEVMAMCAATHLLCGNREKAVDVTEKLLANAHPAAWKLALALAAAGDDGSASTSGPLSFDHGSALLADAAKICPPEELPQLLSAFNLGSPLLSASHVVAEALEDTLTECSSNRDNARDKKDSFLASADEVESRASTLATQSSAAAAAAAAAPACTAKHVSGKQLPTSTLAEENRATVPAPSTSIPKRRIMEGSATTPMAPVSFPIDFDDHIVSSTPEVSEEIPWPSQESPEQVTQAVAPLRALAENTSSPKCNDLELAVYQSILPSLQFTEGTRQVAIDALGQYSREATDASPSQVLLCHRLRDMCEEVMRAQGQGECPENHSEPMNGKLTSALSFMHQVCPELDLTCHGSTLADEVLRCAGTGPDAAQALVRAVAGVSSLQEVGLQPSSVALVAAKRAALEPEVHDSEACPPALATLVLWLVPADLLNLLASISNDPSIPRVRQMEVITHIKAAFDSRSHAQDSEQALRLRRAINQAETLLLIRSVFEGHLGHEAGFPLRLDIDATDASARAEWTRTVRDHHEGDFMLQCIEPILEGLSDDFKQC